MSETVEPTIPARASFCWLMKRYEFSIYIAFSGKLALRDLNPFLLRMGMRRKFLKNAPYTNAKGGPLSHNLTLLLRAYTNSEDVMFLTCT